jgi:cellulase
MDLWEANSAANALTPHACNITGLSACTGDACGFNGTCDQWGCGFNAYGQGNQYFYGPNLTVDTTRPFTVVTQFVTDDNTTTGNLESIRRFYVQDGKIHEQPTSKTSGLSNNDISTAFCTSQGAGAAGYLSRGGNAAIAKALDYGMVLIFSIWDDAGGYMTWLDSGSAGPCSADSGVPSEILADYPNTQVTWSDVKWGELGSTYTTTS